MGPRGTLRLVGARRDGGRVESDADRAAAPEVDADDTRGFERLLTPSSRAAAARSFEAGAAADDTRAARRSWHSSVWRSTCRR